MKKNLHTLIKHKYDLVSELAPTVKKRLVFLASLLTLLFFLPFLGFSQNDGDMRSLKTGGGWASASGGTFEVYTLATDSWASSATAPTATTNVTIMDGVNQTSNGSGYVAGTITVGQGNAFSGTAVLTGTAVTSVNITNAGALMVNPGVTFIGPASISYTGWVKSTAYNVGDQRANGQNLYTVVTAGTSAASGGPTGTGTSITDGTVVWNYVSPVTATGTPTFKMAGAYYRNKGTGYTTATVAIGTAWAASTAYAVGAQRSNGGNLYTAVTAGTSDVAGGPTGTGTNITDGAVVWNYSGTAATAHATVSGGQITGIVVDNTGGGYIALPGLTITGDGTGASYAIQVGVDNIIITYGGNYTVAPQVIMGSVFQVGNSANARTVTVSGDVTFKSGSNLVSGGGSSAYTEVLNIGGNLIAESPISLITIVPASTSSTTVNFTKTGTATISGVGPIAFNNLTFGATTTLIDNSTITIAGNTNFNSIASFNFTAPSVTGTIDRTNHTVSLAVPGGTSVTALVPTITLIDLAGGSISPLSGVVQDFTNPVTYTVTAQDGVTTQAWTVTVTGSAVASTDATLSALTSSSGTLSPVFAAGTTTYSVILPAGTIAIPTVSATVNEAHATTQITQAASTSGSATVVVTAQDGTTKITYTVNFSVAASTDATLSALTVSAGTLSPAFAAGTTTYSVVLPAGTTTVPTITATVTEAHATTVITPAASVTGSGTVAVTAQDGTTKITYTINFSVATGLSTDATLSALTVSTGTLSPAFAAGTTTYSVVLPYGTPTAPTISGTVNEAHATTVITQASSVTGSGTVVVTAQDGTTKITYTVNFSVAAALSTDATLSALTVSAGTLSPAFAAGTTTYSVVLPAGTTTVPTITATVTEAHATTVITPATSVTGSGTVVVTAQDGTTKKTYTVNFSVAASTNATLSALTVSAGTLSPAFAAGTTTYSVVLPAGTTTVPTITATVTEAHATTVITPAASVTGSGTVVVTAQDGTTKKTYTVNFSLAAPAAPVASAATSIAKTTFFANWVASTGASGYRLDVATDAAFTAFVSGFNDLPVANVTTYSVTGLTAATTYYYRVRATNSGGTSASSNSISVISLGTAVPSLTGDALIIAVTTNAVNIESANSSIVAIQIVTVNGKLIAQKNIGSTSATISTDGWSSGIYVFTIKTQDEVITKKIAIVK